MSIQIKELEIKIFVQERNDKMAFANDQREIAKLKRNIVKECKQLVLEEIKQKQRR